MNKLIHGDAFEEMQKLIDNSVKVDAIITDIPYGVTQNAMDVLPDIKELFDKVFKVSNVFITTAQGNAMLELLKHKPKNIKWYDLVWDKDMTSGFLNANRQPLRQHENVFVFYKGKHTYNPQMWESGKPIHGSHGYKEHNQNNNYGNLNPNHKQSRAGKTDRYPTSIVKFKKDHPSITVHPTQKSLELMKWLINTYTNEGQLVLDPFMGSGTTCLAAKELKRNFIGIEKDLKYFEIAKKRIGE